MDGPVAYFEKGEIDMALTWEWKEKCGEVIVEQKTESGD